MPNKREYGDFEISGQAALHAGDRVTYLTNTGTVLFVDSHHIDLERLMPQLKQHSQYRDQSKQPTTLNKSRTSTDIQPSHSASSSTTNTTSHQTQNQTQTQLQLYEAYACNTAKPDNSELLATARLKSHLDTATTPRDKVLDLVTKSTQHLHLQSPSDFRPSALLRQSIGLAGYVAVSLVTIGVDAVQDSYQRSKTQTGMKVSTTASEEEC